MLFENWFGLNGQRTRLLKKMPPEPLREFLLMPFPSKNTPIKELELLVLDFETTGLNPKNDCILSIGYTHIKKGVIWLRQSEHLLVNNQIELAKDNVQIHNITDSDQAGGQPLEFVIKQLLSALAGKVMLVHYAQIELSFLKQACLKLYGMTPVFPVIDTLMIAKRRLDFSDIAYDPSMLRLVNLRNEYQLPPHHEHNALNDAIATGELFLAQLQQMHFRLDTPLKTLSY